MNSMYHDSAALPDGLTEHEAATALAVQDLYALRAVTAAMFADLASSDPFGAQTETAADAVRWIEYAVNEDDVAGVLVEDRADLFAHGVAAVDWRSWGDNAGPTAWDRTTASWGVLSDKLVTLAAYLDGAGLSDAAEYVRRAALHADDIADS